MSVYDLFHKGYLASVISHEKDEDEAPLSERFDTKDFSSATFARTHNECRDFLEAFSSEIDINVELAGRLFWTSRNPGRPLTFLDHAHVFGQEAAQMLHRAAQACGSRTVTLEGHELLIA